MRGIRVWLAIGAFTSLWCCVGCSSILPWSTRGETEAQVLRARLELERALHDYERDDRRDAEGLRRAANDLRARIESGEVRDEGLKQECERSLGEVDQTLARHEADLEGIREAARRGSERLKHLDDKRP